MVYIIPLPTRKIDIKITDFQKFLPKNPIDVSTNNLFTSFNIINTVININTLPTASRAIILELPVLSEIKEFIPHSINKRRYKKIPSLRGKLRDDDENSS